MYIIVLYPNYLAWCACPEPVLATINTSGLIQNRLAGWLAAGLWHDLELQ
jgi:hypothetical protein